MKFKDKFNISSEFEDIFEFASEEEELEHDAQILMFKFLEEIEKCYNNGPRLKQKDFAEAIDVSPSFVSQLYSGEKIINFSLLAKIQKAFNISFEIKARVNQSDYKGTATNVNIFDLQKEPEGFWFWMNKKPDYSKSKDDYDSYGTNANKITAA